ncbi:MAG: DNA alkylation repair protein [Clostridia bacterium]|nr:DNA alkylation repair protein [Clostridia bacterium]
MNGEIKRELISLADRSTAEFSKKLISTKAEIMGVKTPLLKRMAKEISKGDYKSFLGDPQYGTYEETAIRALVISYAKMPHEERMSLIADFVPHIDNWGICDLFTSSLRPVIKKNQSEFWSFIQEYLYSGDEFKIRFGLVVILVGFVSKEYAAPAFDVLDSVDLRSYYAMMGAAWVLSEFYIKLPEITTSYLLNNRLDDITYNKAISKMLDSYRVSDKDKAALRLMKRKGKSALI